MPRTPDTSPQTLKVFGALLADPQGWHYGYALSKQTGLRSGTLYPILIRLVERELLETRWAEAEPGRPPRHLYRLTPDGAQLAADRLTTDSSTADRPAGRERAARPGLTPRTAS